MVKTLLGTFATLTLCTLLTGCNGSDSDSSTAGRDKGPRPQPTTPVEAPGVGGSEGARTGDTSTKPPSTGG